MSPEDVGCSECLDWVNNPLNSGKKPTQEDPTCPIRGTVCVRFDRNTIAGRFSLAAELRSAKRIAELEAELEESKRLEASRCDCVIGDIVMHPIQWERQCNYHRQQANEIERLRAENKMLRDALPEEA